MHRKGQTLVEAAIALPTLCLGIFMGVQLLTYGHNMIELQRMAQVMGEEQTERYQTGTRKYWMWNQLWGKRSEDRVRTSMRRAWPWRRHRGISTLRQPGAFYQTQVTSRLLPGPGFSRGLSSVSQVALAQGYFEPQPPEER